MGKGSNLWNQDLKMASVCWTTVHFYTLLCQNVKLPFIAQCCMVYSMISHGPELLCYCRCDPEWLAWHCSALVLEQLKIRQPGHRWLIYTGTVKQYCCNDPTVRASNESDKKFQYNSNLRLPPASLTDWVAIAALPDPHWRPHLFQTHLSKVLKSSILLRAKI